MATFTITTAQNIDELTSKAGGDTYNINGGTLTIDQDSRVGLNQTTSASLGPVTLSATLGGDINIDGSKVRLIPYNSGSGNVPAWNTAITQGSASGKLIGVYASLTSASVATGAAMPASGYIKIKQWNETAYSSGALSGIGASATGADIVGWLEIVGDEASVMTLVRLGELNITGAWFEIGTTSGSSNQTMQIPNNGLLRYVAGVFIEKTSGAGDYEFWPNAGTTTTTGTEEARGKVVWIDNAGLVRIGNSGAATNGHTPTSGRKVVVGNIFFENCTTAARTANVIPNATIANRYEFVTTGGGVINADKCNIAWYAYFDKAYSTILSNLGIIDALTIKENGLPFSLTKVGVGNKPTTALVVQALSVYDCLFGGTFTDCVFAKVSQSSFSAASLVIAEFIRTSNINSVRSTFRANTIRAAAAAKSIAATDMKNGTFTDTVIIQSKVETLRCDGITFTNTVYVDCVSGTTVTTYESHVWTLTASTKNCKFDGLTFPVTNCHPYTGLLKIYGDDIQNIKLRNIGTYASPLNCGTANAVGVLIDWALYRVDTVEAKRIYTTNVRTGICSSPFQDNAAVVNVFGDYGDSIATYGRGLFLRGIGATPDLVDNVTRFGTHFLDVFTSTTAGYLGILMNEPSAATTSQVTLSSGAAFTGERTISVPTIGMQAIFEMPYYCIGHTGFANSALVMAGGTATNFTYQYQIDKNDGNGFSSWSADKTATTLGTALNGETIDAVLGFKLKLKITTSTTNTDAVSSVYMPTTSTTTTQAYQYPLNPVPVTVTVLDITTLAAIQSARVLVEAASGGQLPASESVTITRSSSTATVSHTAHGLSTGMKVVIRGANQDEYNGIYSIIVTGVDSYTYTVTGTPATTATGTITASAVILYGVTDSNGLVTSEVDLSASQPMLGKVRRSTTGTRYKTGTVAGTISAETGISSTVLLVSDE